MMTKADLLALFDEFLTGSPGLPEKTLSYRIFQDSKTITNLRGAADITLGRCNMALRWLAANWPPERALPAALGPYVPTPANPTEDAA